MTPSEKAACDGAIDGIVPYLVYDGDRVAGGHLDMPIQPNLPAELLAIHLNRAYLAGQRALIEEMRQKNDMLDRAPIVTDREVCERFCEFSGPMEGGDDGA